MAQHAYVLEESRLSLLRGFTFQDADLPLAAQRLVAFLALQERPVRRDYVAGRLWPEASETRAHGALRTTIWRVARVAPEALWVAGPHLALSGHVVVDVHETTALARSVIAGAHGTDHRDLSFAGDLLPDWYDDWVVFERERLRQLRLHALEILCDARVRAGRFAEGVVAGLAAVAGDPLRESAHRVLISAYLAQANASDALRQYDLYRRHLAEALGLAPSPRMRALLASVHEPPVSRAG